MNTTGVLPLELACSIWRCSRSVISAMLGPPSWATGSPPDESTPLKSDHNRSDHACVRRRRSGRPAHGHHNGEPRTCEVEMTLGENAATSAVGALESVEAAD